MPQPPIGEQLAISAALGRVRDAIRAQDQSVAVAQDLKRVAMHTLFTRGLRVRRRRRPRSGCAGELGGRTTWRVC